MFEVFYINICNLKGYVIRKIKFSNLKEMDVILIMRLILIENRIVIKVR